MTATDVRWLSLNSALCVARGGLREVVKRLARDANVMTDAGVLNEVATIRYLADTLEKSVTGPSPNAASAVPNGPATPRETR